MTYTLALCCGAKLTGMFGPEKLNSLPLTVTWVMVRLDLLVLVTGMGTELMLPTWTFPKLTLAVEVEN